MHKSVLSSVSFLWLGSIVAALLGFVMQVTVANHLEAEVYGVFYSVLSMVTIAAPLAGFGVSSFWLKIYGQEGWAANRWLKSSFSFVFVTSVLVVIIIVGWAILGPNDELSKVMMFFLLPFLVGQAFIELISAKYQLEERFFALTVWQAIPHCVRFLLLAIFILLFEPFNFKALALIYSVVAVLVVLSGIWILTKMCRGEFSLKGHGKALQKEYVRPTIGSVFSNSWAFGVSSFLFLLYNQGSVVFTKYLADDFSAGIYGASYVFLSAALLLPSAIYQKFLLPKLHRWATHDKGRFKRVYHKGNTAMLGLGLVVMVGYFLVAGFVPNLFYGEEYSGVTQVLRILAINIPIMFLVFSMGAVLSTGDHIYKKIKCMSVAVVANGLSNILLTPKYGAEGAAVSSLVGSFLLMVMYFFSAKRVVAAA